MRRVRGLLDMGGGGGDGRDPWVRHLRPWIMENYEEVEDRSMRQ
jgi:hypothetical protein